MEGRKKALAWAVAVTLWAACLYLLYAIPRPDLGHLQEEQQTDFFRARSIHALLGSKRAGKTDRNK